MSFCSFCTDGTPTRLRPCTQHVICFAIHCQIFTWTSAELETGLRNLWVMCWCSGSPVTECIWWMYVWTWFWTFSKVQTNCIVFSARNMTPQTRHTACNNATTLFFNILVVLSLAWSVLCFVYTVNVLKQNTLYIGITCMWISLTWLASLSDHNMRMPCFVCFFYEVVIFVEIHTSAIVHQWSLGFWFQSVGMCNLVSDVFFTSCMPLIYWLTCHDGKDGGGCVHELLKQRYGLSSA